MSEDLKDSIADVCELERRIGYPFEDRRLLELALTHPSFKNEHPEVREHNQRLEFLGDAVLELIVGEMLFKAVPDASEGQLTRLKASLVSTKSLASVAKKLGLFEFVRVGRGARKKDEAHEKEKVLCACLEAIVGAVFVDGGFDEARRCVIALFGSEIEDVLGRRDAKDPKSLLQEVVQRKWQELPVYRLVKRDGPPHAPTHVVEVLLPDGSAFRGEGRSRKEAETKAAEAAINGISGTRFD
jgi:ribonuclease-3